MIRPNFLYIGIARAGSTWLFDALRAHPEVFVPPAKDLYFFDRYYEKGLAWYLSHFQEAGGARAVGELSHDYYFSEEAPDRIRADLPDVRLICCLREPVDRLRSGYAYNRTTGLDASVSIDEYAADPAIRSQFAYHDHLKRYIDRFGRDRVLVIFYEDLVADPSAFIVSVYRFLEVDPGFQPPNLAARVNPARTARIEAIAWLVYRAGLVLRGLGRANFVGRVKQSALLNRLLYRPRPAANDDAALEVSPALVAALRAENGRLEALIGRPLPEHWHG